MMRFLCEQETAVNIAQACRLIDFDQELLVINVDNEVRANLPHSTQLCILLLLILLICVNVIKKYNF